jgi:hypothetical protein
VLVIYASSEHSIASLLICRQLSHQKPTARGRKIWLFDIDNREAIVFLDNG